MKTLFTLLLMSTLAGSPSYASSNANIVNNSFRETSVKYDATINVDTAGKLSKLITDSEKYKIKSLKLTGEINSNDVKLLRDMAGADASDQDTQGTLNRIDMSGVKIVAGGDPYLSYYDTDNWEDVSLSTENDLFPTHFFHGTALTSIILPTSVTKIGNDAFSNCPYLTSVTIPQNVTELGNNAFSGSGLTSIIIPNTVTKLGTYAFWGCANMVECTVSDNLTEIPEGAFSQAAISSFTIPEKVTKIGSAAFQYCYSLTKVDGGQNVSKIDSYAFNYCKFSSIKLPDSLKTIGIQAFSNNGALTNLTIPAKVNSIGASQFIADVALTSIDVDKANNDFTSDNGMLYNKEMTKIITCPAGKDGSITVKDGTKEIGESSFANCVKVTDITLPQSVDTVGNDAFDFCTSLNVMKADATTPPSIGWKGAFYSIPETCELMIPMKTKAAYAAATGWKDFKNIVENDPTAIVGINKNAETEGIQLFNINGEKIKELEKGINIIKYENGTTKKVIKK
jgi:hypothetical protein